MRLRLKVEERKGQKSSANGRRDVSEVSIAQSSELKSGSEKPGGSWVSGWLLAITVILPLSISRFFD